MDAGFVKSVQTGDVVVAGSNFGCGSSREHAPIALKAAGVSCVIAETFARIFYRNSINIGLPILECPAAAQALKAGDVVEVDLASGRIVNVDDGQATYSAEPFPPFMMEIINAGGLIAKLAQHRTAPRRVTLRRSHGCNESRSWPATVSAQR